MARVLLGLYNALYQDGVAEKFPSWYDGLIRGLREKGNDLYIWQISEFGKEHTEFSDEDKSRIKDFNPELCISFNNVLPDISFLYGCPEIIIIVDSVKYLSNKELLIERDKLWIGSFQKADLTVLKEYGISQQHLFVTRPYTAVRPDDSIIPDNNICFIGTRFGIPRSAEVRSVVDLSSDAVKKYGVCLDYVKGHPLISEEELIDICDVTEPGLAGRLSVKDMLSLLSGEKRVRILSSVVDLGLSLYGTRSWLTNYHFDSRLNLSFIDKEVWTVSDNQNVYNHSKIGLNISHLQAVDGFPWRVLDILSSNACLVSDYHSGYDEYFKGLHFPIYHDQFEAREVCKDLLKDENGRRQIVRECNEFVRNRFNVNLLLDQFSEISGVPLI